VQSKDEWNKIRSEEKREEGRDKWWKEKRGGGKLEDMSLS